jgi:hypothetical protein
MRFTGGLFEWGDTRLKLDAESNPHTESIENLKGSLVGDPVIGVSLIPRDLRLMNAELFRQSTLTETFGHTCFDEQQAEIANVPGFSKFPPLELFVAPDLVLHLLLKVNHGCHAARDLFRSEAHVSELRFVFGGLTLPGFQSAE